MIFTRALAVALTVLPLLAAANPIALYARVDCDTGHLQCCVNTEIAGSTFGSTLLGLLGIVVPDGNVLIGVECFPIAGPVGVDPGTSSCSANTLCCSNISFGGLVAVDCVPPRL